MAEALTGVVARAVVMKVLVISSWGSLVHFLDPSGAATESGFSDRHGFWGDDLDGPKNKPLPVFWGADSQISSKHSTSEDLMAANG